MLRLCQTITDMRKHIIHKISTTRPWNPWLCNRVNSAIVRLNRLHQPESHWPLLFMLPWITTDSQTKQIKELVSKIYLQYLDGGLCLFLSSLFKKKSISKFLKNERQHDKETKILNQPLLDYRTNKNILFKNSPNAFWLINKWQWNLSTGLQSRP